MFYGVCPTKGPAREPGQETRNRRRRDPAVSRCGPNLDVKPGACKNLKTAHAIIGDLTAAVGTRPSAIVDSGHGLHPYWLLVDRMGPQR